MPHIILDGISGTTHGGVVIIHGMVHPGIGIIGITVIGTIHGTTAHGMIHGTDMAGMILGGALHGDTLITVLYMGQAGTLSLILLMEIMEETFTTAKGHQALHTKEETLISAIYAVMARHITHL